MNKYATILAVAVAMLLALPAQAQMTFYSSDFEANDGGWVGTGEWEWGVPATTEPPDPNDCTTTATNFPPGANSGTNVWGTDLDDCHDASQDMTLSQNFNMSQVSGNVMLCFNEWDATGGNAFDMATVEVNGAVLHLADGTPNAWERICLPMDAFANTASVDIVFRLVTTTVVERAGWYIDDVEITADMIPVELTHFGATVNGTDVNLAWETASETNNAGFEVQMAQDGTFHTLGFVTGNGTTTEAQSYSYSAEGLTAGSYTFRLKQIDFDGAFEYSPEVEATVETPGTHALSAAYPNPFNPQTQFTLSVARQQTVSVAVYNSLGQRVALLHEGTLEANQTETFRVDGAGLASGLYLVRVTGENFADTISLTLTK